MKEISNSRTDKTKSKTPKANRTKRKIILMNVLEFTDIKKTLGIIAKILGHMKFTADFITTKRRRSVIFT